MGGVLGDVERVREVRYDGPDEEERGTFGQEERDSGTDVRGYVSRERDFTFPGGRFREDGESGRVRGVVGEEREEDCGRRGETDAAVSFEDCERRRDRGERNRRERFSQSHAR